MLNSKKSFKFNLHKLGFIKKRFIDAPFFFQKIYRAEIEVIAMIIFIYFLF